MVQDGLNSPNSTVTPVATPSPGASPSPTPVQTPAKLPVGMFSTLGNQIVDQKGNPVRLSCVYWIGMNHLDSTVIDLNSPIAGLQANMDAIAKTGFNCVRVDYNNASLHDSNSPTFISNLKNVVAAAAADNLRVIIVDHDNEGVEAAPTPLPSPAPRVLGTRCAAQQANGIWYDLGGGSDGTDGCGTPGTVTQASYQVDWVTIATLFKNNNTVIGYDLWNEPAEDSFVGKSTWADGGSRDIHQMYEQVGSAILAVDSSKLIFAECPLTIHTPLFDGVTKSVAPWGDCTGVKANPVVFTVNGQPVTNKVVYDVHLYSSATQGYAPTYFPNSWNAQMITAMNDSFGFLESQQIAPVWDGEGGTGFLHNPDDLNWANGIVTYLNGKLGAQGGPTFTGNQQGMGFAWMVWGIGYGANSADNVGILSSAGTVIPAQFNVVNQLFYYP